MPSMMASVRKLRVSHQRFTKSILAMIVLTIVFNTIKLRHLHKEPTQQVRDVGSLRVKSKNTKILNTN